jgi:pyrroline-5-carboxylate reductase
VASEYELGIIGVGEMGGNLAIGFVDSGQIAAGQIIVSDLRDDLLVFLGERGMATTRDSQQVVAQAATVLLAVKPQVLPEVCRSLRLQPDQLVISIAAGVTLARLGELVGETQPIIRVMPNILAAVSEAASAYVGNGQATEAHLDLAEGLLSSVGTAVRVEEKLMDAVTGLSGSGPAFVAAFAEAMIDGGVAAGLPRQQAASLAAQTIKGVGQWLLEGGPSPAGLKDKVTSPGGTTIAGLRALERGGMRSAVIEAVVAAAERSRELGK